MMFEVVGCHLERGGFHLDEVAARLAADFGPLDHRQLLRHVAGQEVVLARAATTFIQNGIEVLAVGEAELLNASGNPAREHSAHPKPLVEAAGIVKLAPLVDDGSQGGFDVGGLERGRPKATCCAPAVSGQVDTPPALPETMPLQGPVVIWR